MSGCEGDNRKPDGEPSRALRSVRRKMRTKEEGEPKTPLDSSEREDARKIVYERTVPRTEVARRRYEPPSGSAVSLAETVPGREARGPVGPAYYLVEKGLEAIHAKLGTYCTGEVLCEPVARDPDEGAAAVIHHLYEVCGARMPLLGEMCLVDLETTGLSSSPLFLIGILVCDGERVTVRQMSKPQLFSTSKRICKRCQSLARRVWP